METMVFEVLIAFGAAIAAEVGFQIAGALEARQCKRRRPGNPAAKPARVGLAAR